MDITRLIVELVSSAVGGNVVGAVMKEKSLGAIGNSIAGIVGGGMDMQGILANVGGGGVGGAILMIVIGVIKQQMAKT